jgi:hypothetical protein
MAETLPLCCRVLVCAQVCGSPDVFCPVGSYIPTAVSPGYFTAGNDHDASNNTRVYQQLCPVGHFCTGGLLMQCPGATAPTPRAPHDRPPLFTAARFTSGVH